MFVSTNAHDFTRGAQIRNALQPLTMEQIHAVQADRLQRMLAFVA